VLSHHSPSCRTPAGPPGTARQAATPPQGTPDPPRFAPDARLCQADPARRGGQQAIQGRPRCIGRLHIIGFGSSPPQSGGA
jgi:hypothetical protein